MQLSTQQIGKCGELLVQYELLLNGIESSRMTTDKGIDLVAYSQNKKDAFTIQVKTNLKTKPGGGKGKDTLGWWIKENTPADFVALVELDKKRIWLFTMDELIKEAQQHSRGNYQLYMYTDHSVKLRKKRKCFDVEYDNYLLINRIGTVI